ncbi:microcephalin [Antennarius striatus]|uniref:microcephalin n=1 Tax=Antennarius striatus TaxID=241820 RepID=UPI0035AEB66D
MTTNNDCPVLKDVVAYVDVWSSDKTANYSKPFVQQLQEMGAQVSKTFTKLVTHVVFYNGHTATWRRAKKSNVKLVSALWVGRCYDDGVHVDEDLYPALDETDPVFKNKKHRCMQPKDTPDRTPENDRRMRKKLDKLMKDLVPKQNHVMDVSPIIIDEENGIIFSPSWKRSDYMAQRLKDMKEKHEKLSPTASQMVESCSGTGMKPSLGSTPTVLRLTYDQSDEDSSNSVAEPAYSPDKEDDRTQHEFTEHGQCSEKTSENCQISTWYNASKQSLSPLKCPDFTNKEDEIENIPKKARRKLIKTQPAEKNSSKDILENTCHKLDSSKKVNKGKRLPDQESSGTSPNRTEMEKQKMNAANSFKENKTNFFPAALNSSSISSPLKPGDATFKQSKQTSTPSHKIEQKTPKRARPSLSALIQSFTPSTDCKNVVSVSTDGDNDVFEDYFSPANCPKKATLNLLPDLHGERDIRVPFELNSVLKKRKQRSESTGSATNCEKKKKVEESQSCKNHDEQSAYSEPQSRPQQDVEESLDSPEGGSEAAAVFTEICCDGKENHNKQDSLSLRKMADKAKTVRTLVMTSMPTEKQHIVDQVVKTLGRFSIVDRVCESTTHVVSGGQRRTLNILLGIARGCWILSYEWILWCLEQRQWVPEEPYELSDQFPAAQICRLQRHLSAGEHQQDLFQSQPAMFVSQDSQPPTQSLMELIQLCGGTVCKTVRQAGICIGKYRGRRPEGSRILSEQWVLDSITHLKRLSYDNYDLETKEKNTTYKPFNSL